MTMPDRSVPEATQCKFCGHYYLYPCDEAKAKACANVKLKRKKAKAKPKAKK